MAKIQNIMKEDCIAVHTDSVITTKPLDKKLVTGKLGELEFVKKGKCILLACGQYEIGDKNAFKGFVPAQGDDWETILNRHLEEESFYYPTLQVHSWVECVARNKFDQINFFEENVPKNVDLNGDIKRIWSEKFKGKDLLTRNEYGEFLFIVNDKPEFWEDIK
jgi:hypothetical protein